MEARVDSLQEENGDLRRTLGIEGRAGQTVVKPSGKEPVLQFGGLLQVQADFRDQGDRRFGTHDRFHLRRARLSATGRFLEEYDFKLEAELSGTLGETTNLRAQMTDGYVNWNRLSYLNVRLGQFKTPFGYEQLFADARLHTIERSLMNDRLTLGRQIGAQALGQVFERRLAYGLGIFNGSGVNLSSNDNDHFLGAGRVEAVAVLDRWQGHEIRWAIGGNGYSTKDLELAGFPPDFIFDSTPGGTADNIFTGDRYGWGADSQFRIGSFDLWVEYLQVVFEPTNGVPVSRVEADGAYVQVAGFVWPRRVQAVAKWDRFDPRRHAAENAVQTWTLGLNYCVKGDDLKLLLNGLAIDDDAAADTQYKILGRVQAIF